MKILFLTSMLVLALAVSGMTFLSARQDHLTGEPHVIVKVAAPPKAFFDPQAPQAAVAVPVPKIAVSNEPQGEIDPGKLLNAVQPAAAPAAAPAAPVVASGPAEVIPGLAVEGFNEQVPLPSASAAAAAVPKPAAAAVPKPAAAPAVAAKPAAKPAVKPKPAKPAVPPAN